MFFCLLFIFLELLSLFKKNNKRNRIISSFESACHLIEMLSKVSEMFVKKKAVLLFSPKSYKEKT